MPHSSCRVALRLHSLFVCLALGIALASQAAPEVWSGLTFEFAKPNSFDFPPPADEITASVALTRASSQGPYNAAQESAWNGSGPLGTRWATNINNPTESIAATNHAALTFGSWLEAYGGLFQAGLNIVGRDAVLHLISDDIYLDIRFTDWTQGSGGGGDFTYLRAEAPAVIPEPATAVLMFTGLLTGTWRARRRPIRGSMLSTRRST